MPEMNGAKLSLADPATGQVIEYEIVRTGTMREFRDLVKATEGRAERLQQLEASFKTASESGRAAAGARDSALKSCEVLTTQRDEAKAELAEMTQKRDEALDRLATADHEKQKAADAAEIDEEAVKQKRGRVAGLLAQLDGAKGAFQANVEEIIGALGDLT